MEFGTQQCYKDYRAGIVTSYLLNGVSGSNNSASFNTRTILGTNTLNGSVTYARRSTA